MPNDADHWAEAEADVETELGSASATASEPGAAAPRDLEQMQRELAANAAKLRSLGVALPSSAGIEQAEDADGTLARPNEEKPAANGGFAPAPEPQPQPGTAPSERSKDETRKQSKRDREDKSAKPKSTANRDGGGDAKPDPAKAAPLSPNSGSPEQDAAGRCSMICELSQITCELNTQICELADRHPQEDDYRSACDRAAEDCEVAQEACHACVG